MQCQEKMKKNKQPEGKTKKTPEEIGAETRMRRHIHRLKPVSSEEINLLLLFFVETIRMESNRCFKKRQEYKMFGKKARLQRYVGEQAQKREA